MNIAMLQKQFEVIDDTVEGLVHSLELVGASRHVIKHTVYLWLITSIILRETRSMHAEISELLATASQPVDPDDRLSDKIFNNQQAIHKAIDSLDLLSRISKHLDFFHHWVVRRLSNRIRKNLIAMHETFGWMRTQIMEHDADYSPIIGSFDNADDLIDALWK